MAACEAHVGVKAANLQHDGVIVMGAVDNRLAIVKDMEEASSHAVGYNQPVAVKPMDLWTNACAGMRAEVAEMRSRSPAREEAPMR